MKRNRKKTLIVRKQLLLSVEADRELKYLAKHLTRGNEGELLRNALSRYTKSANIVKCPECGVPVFDVEKVPILEGISEVECLNGHAEYYDFEHEKWVVRG